MSTPTDLAPVEQWENAVIREGGVDPFDIELNPRNPHIHPERQTQMVEHSVTRLGWFDRITINLRTSELWGEKQGGPVLIDGEDRILLARARDQASIPARWVDYTPQQEAQYLIFKDQTTRMAEFHEEHVLDLVDEVDPEEDELYHELINEVKSTFDQTVHKESRGEGGRRVTNPERLTEEEAHAKWNTEIGQSWVVTRDDLDSVHHIVIGDCCDVLAEKQSSWSIDGGIITSPPYADRRAGVYRSVPPEDYVEWFDAVQRYWPHILDPRACVFINLNEHADEGERHPYVLELVLQMQKFWGWRRIDTFCWRDTRNGIPGKWPNRFKDAWEPIYQFSKSLDINIYHDEVLFPSVGAFKYSPDHPVAGTESGLLSTHDVGDGLALPSNVIECATSSQSYSAAAFPIDLPVFFMTAFSLESTTWLDPFAGGGTTMIAGMLHNRNTISIEERPGQAAIILERASVNDWQVKNGE